MLLKYKKVGFFLVLKSSIYYEEIGDFCYGWLKSEISATDEWKSEISATDRGNRRFLLRMGEIGDFCYGWGKSEISATDGGNRRFLLRGLTYFFEDDCGRHDKVSPTVNVWDKKVSVKKDTTSSNKNYM